MNPNYPIIIFGAGRSGTTLLTQILEDLGFFAGETKESNHESLFFIELNSWIYKQCGGQWDQPSPVEDLYANSTYRDLLVDYLKYLVNTPRISKYLGWKKYLTHWRVTNLSNPWGWKDPRNTFTFPLWMDVFPGAKGIHIRRHGVDVARSLERREKKRMNSYEKNIDTIEIIGVICIGCIVKSQGLPAP